MTDQVGGLQIAFAGLRLDRADAIRANPAALTALIEDGEARLLRLDGVDPVITPEGALTWTRLAGPTDAELVFLGLDDARRGCFAAVPPKGISDIPGPANWAALALLAAPDLATWGQARALVGWHARHRFCARCGHATRIAKGGWQRTCTNPACAAEHFPRVDPVAIMLVEHRDMVLLGRQPRFPAGRYSALAGFVEPAETIEEAVAREVFEEAGVRVRDVAYVASQPWPFPSSLMIACHAMADAGTLTIDHAELEDARWFTRAQVAAAMDARGDGAGGAAFDAPPPGAIAHQLLRWWLDKR